MSMDYLGFLTNLANEPTLSIILFIMPGLIGFITLLFFLPIFEKTTRWRLGHVGLITIMIGSLIWSFIAYFIYFKLNYPKEILANMSISNSLLLMIFSVAFSEMFNILLFISTFLGHLLFTIIDFLLFKKISYHHKKYLSWKRFTSLWKRNRFEKLRGLMIDKRYEEIRNAVYNRKVLILSLKSNKTLIGRMSKDLKDMNYDMSQFKLITSEGISIIKLKDVVDVSIKK